MTHEEFNRLVGMLKIYPGCITQETYSAWYDSLKQYNYRDIDNAARDYIRHKAWAPKPADLIELLPKANNTGKFVQRFETLPDGREARVVACMRCNDTGLITWCDEDDRMVGRPCTCAAAHDNYSWGWLSIDEQQAYCNKHGYHGEVVGEQWA